MLKELSCDKFLEHGKLREPIVFNKGLNIVLGTKEANNAIGKSTFLLIIDFIFGGQDYLDRNKNKAVLEEIGDHTFNYKFEFNKEEFYFSRSTKQKKFVFICDSNYKKIKEIQIDDYRKNLSKKYNLDYTELTFRNAVDCFFRIAGRECLDETKPLKLYDAQSGTEQLETLIKLFNEYDKIRDSKQTAKFLNEKKSAYNKASSFDFIQKAKNKTEFNKNKEEIKKLDAELLQIAEQTNLESQTMDSFKAQEIAKLQTELSAYKRKRTLYANQKNSLINVNELSFTESFELEELKEFFPDINIDTERIVEIESFHKNLSSILKEEVEQNKNNLDVLVQQETEEIQNIEDKIQEIAGARNINHALLIQYSNIAFKKENLENLNKNYLKVNELKDESLKADEQLSTTSLEILTLISEKINKELDYINNAISPILKAPVLTINTSKNYSFEVVNDSSTGTNHKKIIFFDLAMLQLTNIPCICHDSLLVKNIEDPVLVKIFRYYSKSTKQIFTAIDKIESYSDALKKIVNEHKVLSLSDNGGELFGKSLRNK